MEDKTRSGRPKNHPQKMNIEYHVLEKKGEKNSSKELTKELKDASGLSVDPSTVH